MSHTMTSAARGILARQHGGSRNFMTPRVTDIGIITAGGYQIAYELSQGEFMGREVYGLSLVAQRGGRTHLLWRSGRAFGSATERAVYLGELEDGKRDLETCPGKAPHETCNLCQGFGVA